MSLAVGTRLGPYEILSGLGAGGMGEVYRARDTKLDREVAIKVLPELFVSDPERVARFQREAKTLAALNHPHIGGIYGLEDAGGVRALVLELVEGPTLADRIAQGPIPLDEALPIARQIAEALEAAHEAGIIHRDLKPANIKLRPDGTVKVLDFGLAKALEPMSAASASVTASPTITTPAMMTGIGMILGTAAYMSPEQAKGRPADKRSDVWAFGAVLFEMLTGQRAFKGEDVSDTLAAVLRAEPDWTAWSADTPVPIRTLLRRCLTKDRRQRLQAIGEARIVIEEMLTGSPPVEATAAFTSGRRASPFAAAGWIVAAALAGIATAAFWTALRRSPPPAPGVVRLATPLPVANLGGTLVNGGMALSRDGSRLAFVSGQLQQIHVRAMDQLDATALAGTDGASFLAFSPDGQSISYITGERSSERSTSRLKRVSASGGPSQNLADAASVVGPPMQNWAATNDIYYTNNGVLMRIAANGGKAELLAKPDPQRGEVYYAGPQLLPDGQHVLVNLFSVRNTTGHAVVVLDLQTHSPTTVLEQVGIAQYLPTDSAAGYIAYYDQATASLMAVAFDWQRRETTGSPTPVVEGIRGNSRGPFGAFTISDAGTLVYAPGTAPETGSILVWVDRTGTEQALAAPSRSYVSGGRVSPDGQRVAVSIAGEDIWVFDIARGTLNRITAGGTNGNPIWTPDGKYVIYERRPQSGAAILQVTSDGSAPPSVLASGTGGPIVPVSVSQDGKLLIGSYALEGKLWSLSLPVAVAGVAQPQPLLDARVARLNPALSPDAKWIAYRSDETGRPQVYVSPVPGPGGKFPISTDGGSFPRWSRSGRELFYRNADKMMAVDIQTTPEFHASVPKLLFERRYAPFYDVDADGKRFLMIKRPGVQQTVADQVNVVLNWFTELKQRVPTR